jgi:hypothetical protein
MNTEPIKAAAVAYVAAGGTHEIAAVFLPMFRVAVGEAVTEAEELSDGAVEEAKVAPAKKAAKPKS